MTGNIAFPMYDVNPAATDTLAAAVLRRFPDARFQRPEDLLSHWQDDNLLLSQTCGYPLMTALDDVQVVGCLHYTAPGCEGRNYRSRLVARQTEAGKRLHDFRGQVAACNSPESQSGYHALRNSAGHDDTFFRSIVWTGSHRQSLNALQNGTADIAAIDCVSLALFARYQPQALTGLTVVGETPLTPGLPLITSRHTSAQTLNALREALREIADEAEITAPLLIGGFSPASRRDYDVILKASSCA
ncbi:phosphate/phosphite/phosphonate ABC transporter substrate-binding protein [Scandinavium manionii]|uniref:phosphate/phosphite/phosphonate ABC transporter substrate-binding protein n=1 Tax=Scandinavium manionii TaxID=2926520 RepID=UPI0021664CF4|nr:PhnD/SsuA/transferrin family substrate-binding protein [Scandinavium manionii]MCS2146983.1 PhnD/SsuA/transferrin family substrate-binding protein [Scandinavium manionii]